ncbi:MAG: hypothetical protein B7Z55_04700 [Planctomycetales bacterium 12-60-4]|nr:MAG: hypothetical protein B7Z55_04700 [Planctomycetales bacterium 12-60-4]
MSTTAKYDDLNTPMIAIVGFVSAIFTFVAIVGFQAAYYYVESGVQIAKAQAIGPAKNDTILAEQRGKLASYAWADRSARQVTIPIEQAMSLVLREQAGLKAAENGVDAR